MNLRFSAGEKQGEIIAGFGNKKCEVSFKKKEKSRSRKEGRKQGREIRREDVVVKKGR